MAEVAEEGAFLVNFVKLFGLILRQVQALLRHDVQAVIFEFRVDLARQIAAGCIRLDDSGVFFGGARLLFRSLCSKIRVRSDYIRCF